MNLKKLKVVPMNTSRKVASMKPISEFQMLLLPEAQTLPAELENFPSFRYMGSKFRLLPWIHATLSEIGFDSASDVFSGSGVVSNQVNVLKLLRFQR